VIVGYGNAEDGFANIAIECEDCHEVLVDFDAPFYDEEGKCEECGSDTYVNDHDTEGDGETYCMNEQCENAMPDWGSIGEPS
jgi:hypothetical protein